MLIGLFGTGRNGSSLIGRLLDGLQDTFVHPVEEKFLTAFDDLAAHGRVTRMVEQNCTHHPLRHLEQPVAHEMLAGYFGQSLKDINKHCANTIGLPEGVKGLVLDEVVAKRAMTAKEFVPEYLTGIAGRVRPDVQFRHHLFKSIEVPYIGEYQRLFPEMRFVHIMRDPVTVCSSQKRSLLENKGLPASYLGFDWLSCMLDERWVPHARFVAEHRGDPRHIIVRYEDLVVSPEKEIGRIAAGLGLTPPPRPTEQTIFHDLDKTSWGGNPSKKGVETPAHVEADLQSKNSYDEVLTQREIDLIAVKTRDLLRQFDYPCPSSATRMQVAMKYLRVDKWELANCGTPRYLARGLLGLAYRRLKIFS
jgi:hypothetical protein